MNRSDLHAVMEEYYIAASDRRTLYIIERMLDRLHHTLTEEERKAMYTVCSDAYHRCSETMTRVKDQIDDYFREKEGHL